MASTVLGITAATWAVVMALSPILQVRKILERRSSRGVSLAYFGVLLVGFLLWLAYGLARHDVPLVVPNAVAAVVMVGTIVVILRYR
jgi:MtN3 and saliva related transmembrane protein